MSARTYLAQASSSAGFVAPGLPVDLAGFAPTAPSGVAPPAAPAAGSPPFGTPAAVAAPPVAPAASWGFWIGSASIPQSVGDHPPRFHLPLMRSTVAIRRLTASRSRSRS